MKRFFYNNGFILVWGAALLLYWPAAVALSIVGLAVDGIRKRQRKARWA